MTSANFNEQPRSLNGPERVAALLLSVDKFVAQRILKHFDQNELRQITKFAAGLGSVAANTLEPLIDEFVNEHASGSANLLATAGEAEQLLTGVIPPEQVADIMSDVLGSSNNLLWERLSTVPDPVLASYLTKEHAQTAALVLTKVEPSCAARVLGRLPSDVRNILMRRMLSIKPVVDAAMRILETTLQEDLLLDATHSTAATNARVAEIINKMEHEQVEGLLQDLAETRPKVAEALKALLFTFDDILGLTARARMVVFDLIPAEQVILALRGSEPSTRDPILSSLSARVRRMVEAELASGDPTPRREIVKARRLIADTVLKLAAEGKIELGHSDDDADA